jgi:H+/Cl- antiporter ClcA
VETKPRKVRRAPNIVPFLVTGALLGFLVGVAIALIGPDNPDYSTMTLVGLFGVMFAALGLLVAGVVLVVVDKRSLK